MQHETETTVFYSRSHTKQIKTASETHVSMIWLLVTLIYWRVRTIPTNRTSSSLALILSHRNPFERLNLTLEELDIVYRLIQHGSGVHLGTSWNEPLQYPYPLTYLLSPKTRGHTLWIFRDFHILSLRRFHRLGVDVHGLHRCDMVYHLTHGRGARERRLVHEERLHQLVLREESV